MLQRYILYGLAFQDKVYVTNIKDIGVHLEFYRRYPFRPKYGQQALFGKDPFRLSSGSVHSEFDLRRAMRFEDFAFGSIRIDGVTHEHDVVIDHGDVHKEEEKSVQGIP